MKKNNHEGLRQTLSQIEMHEFWKKTRKSSFGILSKKKTRRKRKIVGIILEKFKLFMG